MKSESAKDLEIRSSECLDREPSANGKEHFAGQQTSPKAEVEYLDRSGQGLGPYEVFIKDHGIRSSECLNSGPAVENGKEHFVGKQTLPKVEVDYLDPQRVRPRAL